MKKLFVSVPMKGRTEENIKNSIEKMHKIAELTFGEELELIDTYIDICPPENVNKEVWYLGKSIEKMAEADYFIGVQYAEDCWRGCDTEARVAQMYGIRSTFLSIHDCEFLSDAFRIQRERWSDPVCITDEKV